MVLQSHHTMPHLDSPDQEWECVLRLWGFFPPHVPSTPLSVKSQCLGPSLVKPDSPVIHGDSPLAIHLSLHRNRVALQESQATSPDTVCNLSLWQLQPEGDFTSLRATVLTGSPPFSPTVPSHQVCINKPGKTKTILNSPLSINQAPFPWQSSTLQKALMTRAHCSSLAIALFCSDVISYRK